ncbi:MAG: hypothetical protein ACTS3T_19700 [Almyronema sp.]
MQILLALEIAAIATQLKPLKPLKGHCQKSFAAAPLPYLSAFSPVALRHLSNWHSASANVLAR